MAVVVHKTSAPRVARAGEERAVGSRCALRENACGRAGVQMCRRADVRGCEEGLLVLVLVLVLDGGSVLCTQRGSPVAMPASERLSRSAVNGTR